MPQNRYFIKYIHFTLNTSCQLKNDEFHHLCNVMRAKINDRVEIINGKNQLAKAKIIEIKSKYAILHIEKVIEIPQKTPKIILAQALLRQNKLDLILEKATEVGIFEFILFKAQNSEIIKIKKEKRKRISSILISAIKQCGRLDLPKIQIVENIEEFKKNDFEYFFADPQSSFSFEICKLKKLKKTEKPICFFVGPEKGFTEEEVSFFNNFLKAKPIKLNTNILRAETASLCAATLLSQIYI